jgi:hypothetical protein
VKLINAVKSFLQRKRGNSLLLSTASTITATVGIYFFVVLLSISDDNKQRIAHLYNAYIIGQSIQNVIRGGPENKDYFSDSQQLSAFRHLLRLDESFHNGEFITLKKLIQKEVILDSLDPTATSRFGKDIGYDQDNTGARIRFLASDGSIIYNSSSLVADVAIFVNLAGTSDAISNAPYPDGEPFFYIVMDPTGPNANGASTTIDTNVHKKGILSNEEDGIQAEQSVILPQDNE